jgi:hypothetical protein
MDIYIGGAMCTIDREGPSRYMNECYYIYFWRFSYLA